MPPSIGEAGDDIEHRLPAIDGGSARDLQTIARDGNQAGCDAIFVAEVTNEMMATAQLSA